MKIKNDKIISEIFAFVLEDKDGEAILSMTIPIEGTERLMPFISNDKNSLEGLRPLAIKIAKDTNKILKLIKLENRKVLEVIEF